MAYEGLGQKKGSPQAVRKMSSYCYRLSMVLVLAGYLQLQKGLPEF